MSITGYIIKDGANQCPVDVCKAVCCRSTHYIAGLPGPCEKLTADFKCREHERGGIKAKPWGCAEYPRNQLDIDQINKQAENAGLRERCQLRFE